MIFYYVHNNKKYVCISQKILDVAVISLLVVSHAIYSGCDQAHGNDPKRECQNKLTMVTPVMTFSYQA